LQLLLGVEVVIDCLQRYNSFAIQIHRVVCVGA